MQKILLITFFLISNLLADIGLGTILEGNTGGFSFSSNESFIPLPPLSKSLENFFMPFESYSLETWREVMSVNIDAMFLMSQAVGAMMLEDDEGGSIIQTASIYGMVGADKRIYDGSQYLGMNINTPASYATSKAAVLGLTKHLAAYWGHAGIRVNSLTPGGVESGQNETFKI